MFAALLMRIGFADFDFQIHDFLLEIWMNVARENV